MEPTAELSEIQHFYKNKTILFTGATSFTGKLLLEKILRLLPVKQVYLLLREKYGVVPETRCAELLDSPVFGLLKRSDPDFFKKVSFIEGDLGKPDLGLDYENKRNLLEEVECIFHCGLISGIGAGLKKVALVNVRATRDLLRLVKQMNQLTMMVVLSSVYSNFPKFEVHEEIYEAACNSEKLIDLCEKFSNSDLEKMREKLLKDWPDEYTFTLNVVEDMLKREGKSQPVSIVRPSLLLPTAEEPMIGCIDKAFGLSAHAVSYAMGVNRVNYFKNCTLDVVPTDYVVSLMIASGWYCGLQKQRLKRGDVGSTEVNVHHCISSQEKPVMTEEWFGVTHTVFRDVPTSRMIQLPMQFNTSYYWVYQLLIFTLHYCMAFLCDTGLKVIGKPPMIVGMYDRLHKSQEHLMPYLLKEWYFSNENTQKLLKRMSFKDRELFNFDILKLNWQTYMVSCAKGIRVYLLNDPMSTLSDGISKQNKYLLIQLLSAAVLVTVLYIIAKFLIVSIIF